LRGLLLFRISFSYLTNNVIVKSLPLVPRFFGVEKTTKSIVIDRFFKKLVPRTNSKFSHCSPEKII
jgi:hypothetical protein